MLCIDYRGLGEVPALGALLPPPLPPAEVRATETVSADTRKKSRKEGIALKLAITYIYIFIIYIYMIYIYIYMCNKHKHIARGSPHAAAAAPVDGEPAPGLRAHVPQPGSQ